MAGLIDLLTGMFGNEQKPLAVLPNPEIPNSALMPPDWVSNYKSRARSFPVPKQSAQSAQIGSDVLPPMNEQAQVRQIDNNIAGQQNQNAFGEQAQVRKVDNQLAALLQSSEGQQKVAQEYGKAKSEGFMGSIRDFLSDPETMARLAIGFNTMRLNPDQGLATLMADRLKSIREQKALTEGANKSAKFFLDQGRPDLAKLVTENPALTKDMVSNYFKTLGGTETMQTRTQVAASLGYKKGDPEWAAIMAGGKPDDVVGGALDKGSKIRSEFLAVPQVKDFSLQSQAYGRVVASAEDPSAAGDLALIFNYMKILDPGSTVREGEFATAQNAGGIDQRIVSMYNRVLNGERLSDPIRADFVDRAGRLYGKAESQYSQLESYYKGVAKDAGLDPEKALPSFRFSGSIYKKPKKPSVIDQATWDRMTPDQQARFVAAGNQ